MNSLDVAEAVRYEVEVWIDAVISVLVHKQIRERTISGTKCTQLPDLASSLA